MEYRRRRRRRRRTANGSAGKVIVALLVAAAIIYMVSASAAGTWIAKNVMAPLFDSIESVMADKTVSGTKQPEARTTPQGDLVSREITMPGIDCYMVQMGAYSSMENAQTHAALLQAKGAGGYIIFDGDKYKVMASGYADEASARSVMAQLQAEAMDCTLYTVSQSGASFKVTATEAQLKLVESGFAALKEVQDELGDAVLTFDKEQQKVDTGKSVIAALCTKLEDAQTKLGEQDSSNSIIVSVLSTYTRCVGTLDALANDSTQSFVEYSAKLKHAHLMMSNEYALLVKSLTQ